MRDLVALLVLAVCLALVMGCLALLARHVRRRGTAGAALTAAMAAYDEAFRVTAHESHHEIQAQALRKAPLLSPGLPGDDSAPRPRRGTDQGLGRRARRPRWSFAARFRRARAGRSGQKLP
ncbi:hypothetical protein ACIGBL_30545 [Streptomyces sp. NPDC085614]|uniref:hypothetical protein n=1 Tax=unclassified Streptomyces TaxID=2593676 RepID=UPI0021C65632|nr:hypothetical protein [Streptomyces sp. ms191]